MNARLLVLLLLAPAGAIADVEKRGFTVRDSVQMSYFGTIADSEPEHSYDDGSQSPNGQFVVKMSHRGLLPDGLTEGTIWIFDTEEILESIGDPGSPPPKALPLVRMSAAINGYTSDFYEHGNVLFQLMWSDDGRYLYFLGRDGQENRQLFRVEISSKSVEPLSKRDQDVMSYRLVGDAVAYVAGPNVDSENEWASSGSNIADDVIGTGTPLLPLLYPNFRGYAIASDVNLEVWQVRNEMPEPLTDEASDEIVQISARFSEVGSSASSDGSHSIITDELLAATNWSAGQSVTSDSEASIRLAVEESLNQPPALVATDVQSGQSRVIFDPNPQLAEIALSQVRSIEWTDTHGQIVRGGLVTPPDYTAAKRYPLVIQTHGFFPDRFFRGGYSDTANAGRALASRGIVVLQVEEPYPDVENPWRELPKSGIDAYLAAIDKLDKEGLIDASRVGISGYSSTGLLATAALVHAPERFAAAVIANSDPLTITGYNSYVDSPIDGVIELLLGAEPRGSGLQDWIELSPAMSTDKIAAPVMIFASDPWHLIGLWDLYASLRYQGKPVELHYIRSGRHNLTKPNHKLSHQEMLVDWFDFWLNDGSASTLGNKTRIDRWQEMKHVD